MALKITGAKRMRARRHAVRDELRRRLHRPMAEQGQYLRAVVTGHVRYFGAPRNGARLRALSFQLARLWRRTLCRRSRAKHLKWEGMYKLIARWPPSPHMCHPYPSQRLIVTTHGRSRMR